MTSRGVAALTCLVLVGCSEDASTAGADTVADIIAEVTADVPVDGGVDAAPDVGPDVPDVADVPVDAADVAEVSVPMTVALNEVAPAGFPEDWIELFNHGAVPVDISGWAISDEPLDVHGFVIPAGTTVSPGEFLVYEKLQPGSFDFGLGQLTDSVSLFDATGALVDSVAWVEGELPVGAGASKARVTDGTGDWATEATPSKGTTNE